MLKKRCVKIGFVLLILIALVIINTNTFGAINEGYYNDIQSTMEVDNTKVDNAAKSTVLLDAISILVYAVGSILEKILGTIFEFMSGDNIFPWADAILFNAVPMLDINVFNPSGTSLVKVLQTVIMNTYYTIFTLALSFFGIAIMITAIKLAVSTIASDKAQYKQAIVKWIMGFIMLWGIHFFMSFAIYLNEQLVITAQNIATNEIGKTSVNINQLFDTAENDYAIVENFLNAMTTGFTFNWKAAIGALIFTAVGVVAAIALPFITAPAAAIWAFAASGVAISALTGFSDGEITAAVTQVRYHIDAGFISNISTDNAVKIITENYLVSAKLLKNSEYVETLERRVNLKLVGDSEDNFSSSYRSENPVKLVAADVSAIVSKATSQKFTIKLSDASGSEYDAEYIEVLRNYVSSVDNIPTKEKIIKNYKSNSVTEYTITYYDVAGNKQICSSNGENKCNDQSEIYILGAGKTANPKDYVNNDTTFYEHAKIVTKYYDNFDVESGVISSSSLEAGGTSIISTLANAFKDLAWETTNTSWKPSRVTIEGALLYAILVAQSLIFFIAYAKRLFYIIILILMAPVVVVFDFFNKFSS